MTKHSAVDIYVHRDVREVERLHPFLWTKSYRALPIRAQIDQQASSLLTACGRCDTAILFQLRSWFPEVRDLSDQEVIRRGVTLEECRRAVAREYGFGDWTEVVGLGETTCDPDFEAAVDAVVTGDLASLSELVEARPDLPRARSAYGHRATLLHYIGANGVETHRQRTPLNAAAVASLLIARGADPAATAEMYGGGQTTLDLLVTSAHPAEAGVTDEVAAVLKGETA